MVSLKRYPLEPNTVSIILLCNHLWILTRDSLPKEGRVPSQSSHSMKTFISPKTLWRGSLSVFTSSYFPTCSDFLAFLNNEAITLLKAAYSLDSDLSFSISWHGFPILTWVSLKFSDVYTLSEKSYYSYSSGTYILSCLSPAYSWRQRTCHPRWKELSRGTVCTLSSRGDYMTLVPHLILKCYGFMILAQSNERQTEILDFATICHC